MKMRVRRKGEKDKHAYLHEYTCTLLLMCKFILTHVLPVGELKGFVGISANLHRCRRKTSWYAGVKHVCAMYVHASMPSPHIQSSFCQSTLDHRCQSPVGHT